VIVMSSYLVQWFENTGNTLLFSTTPYTISGNTCVVCTCRCRVAPQWLQHFCRLHANTRCCSCMLRVCPRGYVCRFSNPYANSFVMGDAMVLIDANRDGRVDVLVASSADRVGRLSVFVNAGGACRSCDEL
jgi:hypothetical protein